MMMMTMGASVMSNIPMDPKNGMNMMPIRHAFMPDGLTVEKCGMTQMETCFMRKIQLEPNCGTMPRE